MINISYRKSVRSGEQEVDEDITLDGVLPSEVEKFIHLLRNTPNYSGGYISLPVVENDQIVQHNIPIVFPNL